MPMLLLVIAMFVGGGMGGYLECPASTSQCAFRIDPDFGDGVKMLVDGWTGEIKENREIHKAICSRKNWEMYINGCQATHCPFSLAVKTATRKEAFCVYESSFTASPPEEHMNTSHPDNGRTMPFVLHGNRNDSTRFGCEAESFKGKDYSGMIVGIERGSCAFVTKLRNLAPTGARIGIIFNTGTPLGTMGGTTQGHNIPAFITPTGAEVLIDMVGNDPAEATLSVSCQAGVDNDNTAWDGCPHGQLTRQICGIFPDPEMRMCETCPVEIKIPGYERGACLWGNDISPQRPRVLFSQQVPLAETIVYLGASSGGKRCTVEEFRPFAGKVVAAFLPTCSEESAVIAAQEAGVKGFIIVPAAGNYWPTIVSGTAAFIKIPVGTIAVWNVSNFQLFMEQGTPVAGGWESKVPVEFVRGTTPPPSIDFTPAPTPVPAKLAIESDKKAFEGTPEVIASSVVIGLVIVALVILIGHHRKEAMDLSRDYFTIPLGTASTGLSLTLLIIITIVAFLLAYNAGQQAVDTAMDNGRKAVDQTHQNAVENLADLSSKLLSTVVGSVVQGLSSSLDEGHDVSMYVRRMYQRFDGSWESFDANFENLVYINQQSKWKVSVLTTNGFFANANMKTDSRPDNQRNDGHQHVSVTRNGSLYNWETYVYDESSWRIYRTGLYRRNGIYDPFRLIGSNYGDPIEKVRNDPDYWQRWVAHEYNLPASMPGTVDVPLVTLTGLANQLRQFSGAVVAERDISKIATEIIKDQTGSLFQNVTVFIVDANTDVIISTTAGLPYKSIEWLRGYGVADFGRRMYTVDTCLYPEVNAAGNYIRKKYGGLRRSLTGSGKFDQRDYYSGYGTRIMAFDFENTMEDVSGNKWRAEMRDGSCGGHCYGDGYDSTRGLVFDGQSIMYIYTNMTTDVQHIAQTKVGSGPEWQSSNPVYNESTTLPDGSIGITFAGLPILREPFAYKEEVSFAVWMKLSEEVEANDFPGDDAPVIYTNDLGSDPPLRLYANGAFFVSRINYGCRTSAFRNLRPDEWNHIVAVVSWEQRYCAVYRNGVLHEKATMAFTTSIRFSESAHYVGRNLKGTLDKFQVHNKTFNIQDVEKNYLGDSLSNELPSREWFLEFASESRAADQARFVVVAMIPVEDVRRNIDNNNAITSRNLEVEEDNTRKELDQITTNNVFILVVVALVSMFFFILFNTMITAPFTSFAKLMLDVAVMRVESISGSKYVIRELSAMDQAMVLMARNLKEYKSFMPQTVLMQEDSNEEESDQGVVSRNSGSRAARDADTLRSSKMGSSGSGSGSSMSRDSLQAAARMLLIGLARKKVTLIMVNVVDFHGLMDSMPDTELTALHGKFVASVLMCGTRGTPHQFTGDRMLVSFNTAKQCSGHRMLAATFIVQLKAEMQNLDIKISSSAVSGDAKVGNLGTEAMKQYTMLGPVVSWCYTLERHSRRLGLPDLVDHTIADASKSEFLFFFADYVVFPKRHATRGIKLYSVTEYRTITNEEWMYQMEEASRKDPFHIWNEAAQAACAGEENARELFSEADVSSIPELIVDRVRELLLKDPIAPTTLE